MKILASTEPAPAKPTMPPGSMVGSYRLIKELGRGSMGVVYEAIHERIGRRAAVKLLDASLIHSPQALARFLNEARAVNRIEHPGIVEIYDCIEDAEAPCAIVMELLKGRSLQAVLSQESLPLKEAIRIVSQIAEAIAAAHDHGIIHRDLKPENIMLVRERDQNGRIKILDFGLAKIATDGEGEPTWQIQTRATTLLGTPLYMAPEQCKGTGIVDERADVYALGVLLFQMLSGAPPFVAQGAGELLAMHIYVSPPALSERVEGLPPWLCELVDQMLKKNPSERPSMREVCRILHQHQSPVHGWTGQPIAQPEVQADADTRADERKVENKQLARVATQGPSLTLWCEDGVPQASENLPLVSKPAASGQKQLFVALGATLLILLGGSFAYWKHIQRTQSVHKASIPALGPALAPAGVPSAPPSAMAPAPVALPTPPVAPAAAPKLVVAPLPPEKVAPEPRSLRGSKSKSRPLQSKSLAPKAEPSSKPILGNTDVEILR